MPYFFAFFLSNIPRTDGLIDLSVRWMQPIQQHGRRIPSMSSEHALLTWSPLVSGALTEMVQQIHSLRASGVMSSHAARAFCEAISAFRKSAGNVWTVPEDIFMAIVYMRVIHLVLEADKRILTRKINERIAL